MRNDWGGLQRLVLPLLWSTFSARQAVTDQTLFGFREIIAGLRTIRSRRFYKHQPVKLERHHHDGQQQLLLLGKDKSAAPPADEQPPPKMMGESLLIEDMSVIDPEHEDVEENELDDPSEPKTPLYLHSDLDILPPLLDTLRLNLAATSTTRTSLLSTLTAYTSQLNTQSFTSWHGASYPGLSSRVGLKSLDENLAKETWNGKEMVLGRPAPEFEELRKEVRGLKGVLLSR